MLGNHLLGQPTAWKEMGHLCIKQISTLHAKIANEHYPNVAALANELSGGVLSLKRLCKGMCKTSIGQ